MTNSDYIKATFPNIDDIDHTLVNKSNIKVCNQCGAAYHNREWWLAGKKSKDMPTCGDGWREWYKTAEQGIMVDA